MFVLFGIVAVFSCVAKSHFQIDRNNSRLIVQKSRSGYTYAVYKDHIELLKYFGEEANVNVPLKLFGKPVTVIGEYCFFSNDDIITIYLSSNITEIKKNAFNQCSELESVTGEAVLKVIPEMAFHSCSKLKTVHVGNEIERIEEQAFDYCKLLESIGEQPKLKHIGWGAFMDAGTVADLNIPSNAEIENLAFVESEWLAGKTDEFVIEGNGNLLAYNGSAQTIKVPIGVKKIDAKSFQYKGNGSKIQEIYLPDTVVEVVYEAFEGLSNITVYIPDSVIYIDKDFQEFSQKDEFNHLTYSNNDLIIVTTKGAYAEKYARKYKLEYEIVDKIEYPE